MLFSIIMPTYNVEAYVDKSIQSALRAMKNIESSELIIIDDMSEDKTWKKVLNYNHLSNVHLHRIEHCGLGAARNYGLKIAKGDYILFLDSDDYYNASILEKLQNVILSDNSDMIVFQWQSLSERKVSPPYGDETLRGSWLACWNKCYKRDLIKDHSFPEGILYEDSGFSLRAQLDAKNVKFVNKPLYIHRSQSEGISRRKQTFLNRLDVMCGFEEVLSHYPKQEVKEIIVRTLISHLSRSIQRQEVIDGDDLDLLQNYLLKHDLFGTPIYLNSGRIASLCVQFLFYFENVWIVYIFLKWVYKITQLRRFKIGR
ncbi:glycosyltransferase family 2 protein [Weissella cibaria]|uniref:glycosyltransferase family 2 protein n=2 Tax=Weissella cibaria TaxID=137591 RepID=UPI001E4BE983|nr:glycosyltransferase family 2 protein [Weissella cibaria]